MSNLDVSAIVPSDSDTFSISDSDFDTETSISIIGPAAAPRHARSSQHRGAHSDEYSSERRDVVPPLGAPEPIPRRGRLPSGRALKERRQQSQYNNYRYRRPAGPVVRGYNSDYSSDYPQSDHMEYTTDMTEQTFTDYTDGNGYGSDFTTDDTEHTDYTDRSGYTDYDDRTNYSTDVTDSQYENMEGGRYHSDETGSMYSDLTDSTRTSITSDPSPIKPKKAYLKQGRGHVNWKDTDRGYSSNGGSFSSETDKENTGNRANRQRRSSESVNESDSHESDSPSNRSHQENRSGEDDYKY